jgi:Glycosyltransferase family 87
VTSAGSRDWQRIALVVLAAIGGALLAIVVVLFWRNPGDNYAYWLAAQRLVAGEPVYVTGEAAFAPYAYHYTPPLAQVLAPLTLFLPSIAYIVGYRVLEILTVWYLAGRAMLPMLALIAFLPVAIELRFENVHLFMAVAIVLALWRWPLLFAVAAIVKVSPGLGIVYLVLRRRFRDAAIAVVVGAAICAVSYVLSPNLWQEFLAAIGDRAGITGNSLIPVPYVVRAIAGLVLAIAGGIVGRRRGELLLVLAITAANPNLALNGFAVLAAAVPVWRAGPDGLLEGSKRRSTVATAV